MTLRQEIYIYIQRVKITDMSNSLEKYFSNIKYDIELYVDWFCKCKTIDF